MSQAIKNRSALFAAATALTALGFLTAPAQADPMIPLAPACEKWQWPGGNFSIHVGNEVVGQYDVTMATSQDKVVGRPVKQDHAEVITGNPYGGMTGSTIDFTINWDQGPRTPYSSHYTGQINDEGLANGIVHTGNRDDGWSSSQKFSCSTPAAPPQQAKPMATVAADVDVYDAPNINNDKEPLGILRSDQKVEVVGSAEPGQQGQTCAVNSWCTVRGPNVPNGQGVIWGHLKDFTG